MESRESVIYDDFRKFILLGDCAFILLMVNLYNPINIAKFAFDEVRVKVQVDFCSRAMWHHLENLQKLLAAAEVEGGTRALVLDI